jgi:hypothetical protein
LIHTTAHQLPKTSACVHMKSTLMCWHKKYNCSSPQPFQHCSFVRSETMKSEQERSEAEWHGTTRHPVTLHSQGALDVLSWRLLMGTWHTHPKHLPMGTDQDRNKHEIQSEFLPHASHLNYRQANRSCTCTCCKLVVSKRTK